MRSEVLVSLLISGVFGDEVEVFSADDEGSVHLGGDNGSGQDTATDGDETSEGALLVCGESMSVINSLFILRFNTSRAYSSHNMLGGLSRLVSITDSSPRASPSSKSSHEAPYTRRPSQISENPQRPHTDVVALNRVLWGLEAQADVLVPSSSTLADSARLGLRLGVEEDVRLLLESALRLDGKFGGHGCGGRWLSRSQVEMF